MAICGDSRAPDQLQPGNNSQNNAGIKKLSPDLLRHVASFLDAETIGTLKQTSKNMNSTGIERTRESSHTIKTAKTLNPLDRLSRHDEERVGDGNFLSNI